MKSTNRVFCAFAALTFSIGIYAQSGTNSPYSQYGLGVLSDQTSGFNRGMNGVGLGFREHNQVNFINPASYSAVDSLSFIFDVGFSGQITNFNESGKKINAKNADFEYAVAAFRVAKGFGVSFGILPYTNVDITIPLQHQEAMSSRPHIRIHITEKEACIRCMWA